MSFIVRGVFLLEGIATFFRLGWLYLVSPSACATSTCSTTSNARATTCW